MTRTTFRMTILLAAIALVLPTQTLFADGEGDWKDMKQESKRMKLNETAKEAREAFEKSLSLDPAFKDALYSIGNLLSASEPMSAKGYFLRYLEQDPASAADIHYQIALLEHRSGSQDEALKRLRQAIEAEPAFLQARYSLAQIYENLKDTGAAHAEYEALLPLDPQNVGLLVRLGELTEQEI